MSHPFSNNGLACGVCKVCGDAITVHEFLEIAPGKTVRVGPPIPKHCLFVSTVTFDPISAYIRWRTNCTWSHTGWYRLSDGWTYSAMSDGNGLDWRPPNARAKILLLDAPGVDESLAKALEHRGAGYDFFQILGLGLARDWSMPGRFICDKAVFYFQQQAGFPLLNHTFIQLNKLTPESILLSEHVTERKQG